MPEMPQMEGLAERLGEMLVGRELAGFDAYSFSSLKTVVAPEGLLGRPITAVGRRGKYLVVEVAGGDAPRLLVHLSQAGRLDVEDPPKRTKPKGAVLRIRTVDGPALLVREYGTERKAAWWVLAPDDDGPLAHLGPEPDSDAFADLVLHGDDRRRIHTLLRDQRTVAGVGRGYADDALWRAELSPYATLASLDPDARARLLDAVRGVLADGLAAERRRTGGLSEPKLGGNFEIHGRYGTPCPRCGATMHRMSYESHEITYCSACQTGGKVLADRRMSRLLK
ncbi:MAG: Fpg/Nei family DNA glycosylase, partial [Actinobacteria bacterium]|nr:Fpg/Nei family DNA glycosylase [Actinomycetota bacterium]